MRRSLSLSPFRLTDRPRNQLKGQFTAHPCKFKAFVDTKTAVLDANPQNKGVAITRYSDRRRFSTPGFAVLTYSCMRFSVLESHEDQPPSVKENTVFLLALTVVVGLHEEQNPKDTREFNAISKPSQTFPKHQSVNKLLVFPVNLGPSLTLKKQCCNVDRELIKVSY